MYNLTPEQKKTIETATESLSRDIDLLIDQIKKEGDTERRKSLTATLAALVVQRIATEKDLQQRFKEDQLRALGDPELIIKDACAVADYEIAVLFKELTTTAEAITEDAQRDAVAFFTDPASEEPKLNAENVFFYLTEYCDAFEAGCEALAPHFRVMEILWPAEKDALEEAVKNTILSNSLATAGKITGLSLFEKPRPISIKSPKTYGFLNDKMGNVLLTPPGRVLHADGYTQKLWALNPGKRGKKEVPVYITLQYPETEVFDDFSAFDKSVLDALSTMFFYAKELGFDALEFTLGHLWRFMTARPIEDTSQKPSKQQEQDLRNTLFKFAHTRVDFDISNEIRAFKMDPEDDRLKSGRLNEPLLNIRILYNVIIGGKRIPSLYQTKELSVLASHANELKQVILVPYDLLDIKDAGYEGHSIELRDYLLKQIARMKNGSRPTTKILFDTLYKSTGLLAPADRVSREKHKTDGSYQTAIKKEAAKDRKKIKAILDIWKRKGFIKDSKLIKSGKSFSGVDIELPDEHADSKKRAEKWVLKGGKMGTERQ